MIIYSNENVEIEDDGTLHILRDVSRNDVLARVKANNYGGYIVVRATGHYKACETDRTLVEGLPWSQIVDLLTKNH